MRRIIIIVDDTSSSADTLALALASVRGTEVRTVTSAQEALRLASTDSVAAVVTDLHMPQIDGYELIRRLRSEARHAALPIFVISGDSDADTPGRLRSLGANGFFSKPFSPTAVRQALEQILNEST